MKRCKCHIQIQMNTMALVFSISNVLYQSNYRDKTIKVMWEEVSYSNLYNCIYNLSSKFYFSYISRLSYGWGGILKNMA